MSAAPAARSAARASRRRRRTATPCWRAAWDRTLSAPVLTPNLKYDPSKDFERDRLHRAFARRHRRAQGFSGQGREGIRGLSEAERRQGEAGAWRRRRLLAYGVPAVQYRARHQADAGGLSRHRSGGERPGRRPRRFPLRAVRERGRADQGRHHQGLRGRVRTAPGRAPRRPVGEGGRDQVST